MEGTHLARDRIRGFLLSIRCWLATPRVFFLPAACTAAFFSFLFTSFLISGFKSSSMFFTIGFFFSSADLQTGFTVLVSKAEVVMTFIAGYASSEEHTDSL